MATPCIIYTVPHKWLWPRASSPKTSGNRMYCWECFLLSGNWSSSVLQSSKWLVQLGSQCAGSGYRHNGPHLVPGKQLISAICFVGYNDELYRLYKVTDLMTYMHVKGFKWAGNVVRMLDNGIPERTLEESLTWSKPTRKLRNRCKNEVWKDDLTILLNIENGTQWQDNWSDCRKKTAKAIASYRPKTHVGEFGVWIVCGYIILFF